jgi:phosphorylase kinase alpha/beta subunit
MTASVPGPLIHSDRIAALVRPRYELAELDRLEAFLFECGALAFRTSNGIYPAAATAAATDKSGYHNAWVRDNVFVAHAHAVNGRLDAATATALALAEFFSRHLRRFDAIIEGTVDRDDPMARAHVRFDGATLEELPERWAHAQNDALGYFVWLFATLANEGAISLTEERLTLLERFAAYFRAIQFWRDEDSGHWEEGRKISASSIGVVIGGLEAARALLAARGGEFDGKQIAADLALLADLSGRGRPALNAILPAECVQPAPAKRRRYDAALLFLVYPVGVVSGATADRIAADVAAHLQGPFGVRRYVGDSYWCGDYREAFSLADRSADYSEDMQRRDRLLKVGEEAQWCIFDPVMSAIYGRRYRQSRSEADRDRQIAYFNRSLGQITDCLQCPEAWFLERGAYVPNDNTPLLWTAANLWAALKAMKDTATA